MDNISPELSRVEKIVEWFRYEQTCEACGVKRQPGEKLFDSASAMYWSSGPECPKCWEMDDPYEEASQRRVDELLRKHEDGIGNPAGQ